MGRGETSRLALAALFRACVACAAFVWRPVCQALRPLGAMCRRFAADNAFPLGLGLSLLGAFLLATFLLSFFVSWILGCILAFFLVLTLLYHLTTVTVFPGSSSFFKRQMELQFCAAAIGPLRDHLEVLELFLSFLLYRAYLLQAAAGCAAGAKRRDQRDPHARLAALPAPLPALLHEEDSEAEDADEETPEAVRRRSVGAPCRSVSSVSSASSASSSVSAAASRDRSSGARRRPSTPEAPAADEPPPERFFFSRWPSVSCLPPSPLAFCSGARAASPASSGRARSAAAAPRLAPRATVPFPPPLLLSPGLSPSPPASSPSPLWLASSPQPLPAGALVAGVTMKEIRESCLALASLLRVIERARCKAGAAAGDGGAALSAPAASPRAASSHNDRQESPRFSSRASSSSLSPAPRKEVAADGATLSALDRSPKEAFEEMEMTCFPPYLPADPRHISEDTTIASGRERELRQDPHPGSTEWARGGGDAAEAQPGDDEESVASPLLLGWSRHDAPTISETQRGYLTWQQKGVFYHGSQLLFHLVHLSLDVKPKAASRAADRGRPRRAASASEAASAASVPFAALFGLLRTVPAAAASPRAAPPSPGSAALSTPGAVGKDAAGSVRREGEDPRASAPAAAAPSSRSEPQASPGADPALCPSSAPRLLPSTAAPSPASTPSLTPSPLRVSVASLALAGCGASREASRVEDARLLRSPEQAGDACADVNWPAFHCSAALFHLRQLLLVLSPHLPTSSSRKSGAVRRRSSAASTTSGAPGILEVPPLASLPLLLLRSLISPPLSSFLLIAGELEETQGGTELWIPVAETHALSLLVSALLFPCSWLKRKLARWLRRGWKPAAGAAPSAHTAPALDGPDANVSLGAAVDAAKRVPLPPLRVDAGEQPEAQRLEETTGLANVTQRGYALVRAHSNESTLRLSSAPSVPELPPLAPAASPSPPPFCSRLRSRLSALLEPERRVYLHAVFFPAANTHWLLPATAFASPPAFSDLRATAAAAAAAEGRRLASAGSHASLDSVPAAPCPFADPNCLLTFVRGAPEGAGLCCCYATKDSRRASLLAAQAVGGAALQPVAPPTTPRALLTYRLFLLFAQLQRQEQVEVYVHAGGAESDEGHGGSLELQYIRGGRARTLRRLEPDDASADEVRQGEGGREPRRLSSETPRPHPKRIERKSTVFMAVAGAVTRALAAGAWAEVLAFLHALSRFLRSLCCVPSHVAGPRRGRGGERRGAEPAAIEDASGKAHLTCGGAALATRRFFARRLHRRAPRFVFHCACAGTTHRAECLRGGEACGGGERTHEGRPAESQDAAADVLHVGGNVLIFFNPNAGYLETAAIIGDGELGFYRRRGVSVLLFNYRGFGRSAGSSSPAATLADAAAVYRFVASWPGVKTVGVHGRSIGGLPAIFVALHQAHIRRSLVAWQHHAFTSSVPSPPLASYLDPAACTPASLPAAPAPLPSASRLAKGGSFVVRRGTEAGAGDRATEEERTRGGSPALPRISFLCADRTFSSLPDAAGGLLGSWAYWGVRGAAVTAHVGFSLSKFLTAAKRRSKEKALRQRRDSAGGEGEEAGGADASQGFARTPGRDEREEDAQADVERRAAEETSPPLLSPRASDGSSSGFEGESATDLEGCEAELDAAAEEVKQAVRSSRLEAGSVHAFLACGRHVRRVLVSDLRDEVIKESASLKTGVARALVERRRQQTRRELVEALMEEERRLDREGHRKTLDFNEERGNALQVFRARRHSVRASSGAADDSAVWSSADERAGDAEGAEKDERHSLALAFRSVGTVERSQARSFREWSLSASSEDDEEQHISCRRRATRAVHKLQSLLSASALTTASATPGDTLPLATPRPSFARASGSFSSRSLSFKASWRRPLRAALCSARQSSLAASQASGDWGEESVQGVCTPRCGEEEDDRETRTLAAEAETEAARERELRAFCEQEAALILRAQARKQKRLLRKVPAAWSLLTELLHCARLLSVSASLERGKRRASESRKWCIESVGAGAAFPLFSDSETSTEEETEEAVSDSDSDEEKMNCKSEEESDAESEASAENGGGAPAAARRRSFFRRGRSLSRRDSDRAGGRKKKTSRLDKYAEQFPILREALRTSALQVNARLRHLARSAPAPSSPRGDAPALHARPPPPQGRLLRRGLSGELRALGKRASSSFARSEKKPKLPLSRRISTRLSGNSVYTSLGRESDDELDSAADDGDSDSDAASGRGEREAAGDVEAEGAAERPRCTQMLAFEGRLPHAQVALRLLKIRRGVTSRDASPSLLRSLTSPRLHAKRDGGAGTSAAAMPSAALFSSSALDLAPGAIVPSPSFASESDEAASRVQRATSAASCELGSAASAPHHFSTPAPSISSLRLVHLPSQALAAAESPRELDRPLCEAIDETTLRAWLSPALSSFLASVGLLLSAELDAGGQPLGAALAQVSLRRRDGRRNKKALAQFAETLRVWGAVAADRAEALDGERDPKTWRARLLRELRGEWPEEIRGRSAERGHGRRAAERGRTGGATGPDRATDPASGDGGGKCEVEAGGDAPGGSAEAELGPYEARRLSADEGDSDADIVDEEAEEPRGGGPPQRLAFSSPSEFAVLSDLARHLPPHPEKEPPATWPSSFLFKSSSSSSLSSLRSAASRASSARTLNYSSAFPAVAALPAHVSALFAAAEAAVEQWEREGCDDLASVCRRATSRAARARDEAREKTRSSSSDAVAREVGTTSTVLSGLVSILEAQDSDSLLGCDALEDLLTFLRLKLSLMWHCARDCEASQGSLTSADEPTERGGEGDRKPAAGRSTCEDAAPTGLGSVGHPRAASPRTVFLLAKRLCACAQMLRLSAGGTFASWQSESRRAGEAAGGQGAAAPRRQASVHAEICRLLKALLAAERPARDLPRPPEVDALPADPSLDREFCGPSSAVLRRFAEELGFPALPLLFLHLRRAADRVADGAAREREAGRGEKRGGLAPPWLGARARMEGGAELRRAQKDGDVEEGEEETQRDLRPPDGLARDQSLQEFFVEKTQWSDAIAAFTRLQGLVCVARLRASLRLHAAFFLLLYRKTLYGAAAAPVAEAAPSPAALAPRGSRSAPPETRGEVTLQLRARPLLGSGPTSPRSSDDFLLLEEIPLDASSTQGAQPAASLRRDSEAAKTEAEASSLASAAGDDGEAGRLEALARARARWMLEQQLLLTVGRFVVIYLRFADSLWSAYLEPLSVCLRRAPPFARFADREEDISSLRAAREPNEERQGRREELLDAADSRRSSGSSAETERSSSATELSSFYPPASRVVAGGRLAVRGCLEVAGAAEGDPNAEKPKAKRLRFQRESAEDDLEGAADPRDTEDADAGAISSALWRSSFASSRRLMPGFLLPSSSGHNGPLGDDDLILLHLHLLDAGFIDAEKYAIPPLFSRCLSAFKQRLAARRRRDTGNAFGKTLLD
ncbi:hypothetical protein BESB_073870 [Besnoitia besnoiti]|uniref:Serine aminopeptidase S33 domain-containing protein n=1 Tax=Besnoitia besnoiti TaxID=94643 RepID=A0A2A9M8C2_BESBE|nr:uncharacterized protein BESB_073870 [Besnoitia besnoiti]PFH34235.1 hypothetical protein BESB_073870 [Besnoitia besnoiti]